MDGRYQMSFVLHRTSSAYFTMFSLNQQMSKLSELTMFFASPGFQHFSAISTLHLVNEIDLSTTLDVNGQRGSAAISSQWCGD